MFKRFALATITLTLILLTALFILPSNSVEAGGCDYFKDGELESEALVMLKVYNVGINRVLIEISGDPGAEYRVQVDGSSHSGTLNENGDSQRMYRTYEENEGTVDVAIASISGNINYAVDTVNCNDIDSEEYDTDFAMETTDDLITTGKVKFGAAFFDETGIFVYYQDGEGNGTLAASATAEELEDIPECPDDDVVISASEDGLFSISRLETCEYQILMGPDEKGKVEVWVFESLETVKDDVDRVEFSQPTE